MTAQFGADVADVRARLMKLLKWWIVDGLPSGAELSKPIVASWNWSFGADAHEVELGQLRLRYGAPCEWRAGETTLIDAQGRSASLVEPGAWVAAVAPRERGGADARELSRAVVETVACAARERRYELVEDGAWCLFRRVANGRPRESELALEEAREFDPECQIGDEVGTSVASCSRLWKLVDWLFEVDAEGGSERRSAARGVAGS